MGKNRGAGAAPERKLRFAESFHLCQNATKAAVEAGLSPDTAYSQGSRLLKDPVVQAHLRRLEKDLRRRYRATAKKVIRELSILGFSDIADIVEWGKNGITLKPSDEIPPAIRRAIMEISETVTQTGAIKTKIKLHPKHPALHNLAVHFGLLVERKELRKVESFTDLVKAAEAARKKGRDAKK